MPSLRERKKERTRVELMTAAVELFNEQGFDHTTVDDIVARAEYSRSTFHRLFGAKEDVLLGDYEGRLQVMREAFDAAKKSDDPWDVARKVLTRNTLDIRDLAPELEIECMRLLRSEPSLHGPFAKTVMMVEETLAQLVAKHVGLARPDFPIQLRAAAMVSVTRAALQCLESDPDIEAVLEKGFRMVEHGMASASRPTPRRSR